MNILDKLTQATKTESSPIGPKLVHSKPLIHSAVVIPCIQTNPGDFDVLLTVREKKLSSHAGQVCFPGGRYDKALDQDYRNTALRECFEETNISASEIKLLGSLGYLDTITGYRMFPYVGIIQNEDIEINVNPDEISDYFFVPLSKILNASTYTETSVDYNGQHFKTYHFDQSGYRVWGATARILRSLAISTLD